MRLLRSFGLSIIAAFGMTTSLPVAAEQLALGDGIRAAKTMMLSGRNAEARMLLHNLASRYRGSNDIDFLLGLLAVEARDYDTGIRHFRAMLVRQPGAVRVRLELARAFYLKHDYENAFRQFQFARAGKLAPGVAATIDRFLSAIRNEKSWSYNFSVALAPDTNINNGTSAREVLLFGLPFELSGEARRRSGIGIAVDAGAEFAPRIGRHARLRMGGAVQRRDYRDKDFDDMTVALYSGPRLVLDKWDLSATGTAFQRRFGGRRLVEGYGAKLDVTRYLDSRTAASLMVSAHQVRYPRYPLQSGRAYSAWVGAFRALSPSSSLNARLGLSRKTARAPELASWSQSISAGYYRDLAGGFTIYGEPSFTRSRYDAADPFFGKRRIDHLAELHVAVLNRRIVLNRFTPRIGLTLTRRKSSIHLYDLSQRRLEVGFTSAF